MKRDDIKKIAVKMANEHGRAMRGMSEEAAFVYIKDVIDNADIVFGVWQDSDEPLGVGTLIIKGENQIQAAVAGDEPTKRSITAIPCNEAEQAFAVRDTLGDGAAKLN
jgi:hypothetical protein